MLEPLRTLTTTTPLLLNGHCIGRTAIVVVISLAGNATASDHYAANVLDLTKATELARPGDAIILNDGEWREADLHLDGQGTASQPITIRAETPGGVRLTGTSRLRISGSHLRIIGLWFDNCDPPKSDIISFRADSKRLASHCVLDNCAITQDSETSDNTERRWLSLYGEQHVVERCHFSGKTSKGPMVVVWLPENAGSPVQHVIRQNYFGDRPRLGKNGGEIIRVGDSKTSMLALFLAGLGGPLLPCGDGGIELADGQVAGRP